MNYETQFPDGRRSPVAKRSAVDTLGEDVAALRRRRILFAAGVGLLLIMIVSLWAGWNRSKSVSAAADAGQNIPNVTILTVQPGAVSTSVSGTGAIAARRDMPVGVVGEGGRVTGVLVEPGTWVNAGQPLATIERSVQRQEAASLAAQVNVARANAKLAEANLARAQALVGNGFISKADLEAKVAARDAETARLNVAIAQYDQSRATIARLDVRAPARGLVLTRTIEPGQVVSSGSGTLFRIAMNGEMEMKLAVNEADLAGIAVGSTAQVTPVGSKTAVNGTVWQVSPVVDPQTRQGSVRILLPYNAALRPGAFANATVNTGSRGGYVLPESAVQSDVGGNFVLVVGRDNKVIRRPVETGPVSDAGISIMKGLNAGDAIVSTAGGFLTPGDTVNPVRTVSGR